MTHPHGQAMVETALMLPLLLAVIGGGLVIGIALQERQSLAWAAEQGAAAGAAAATDADRCPAALAAVEATLERHVPASCEIEPGPPALVRVRLTGATWPVPFGHPVTVGASAGALIPAVP